MKIIYLSGSKFPSHDANSIHVFRMAGAIATLGHQLLLIGRVSCARQIIKKELEDFYGNSFNFKLLVFTNKSFPFSQFFYSVWGVVKGMCFGAQLYYGRHIESCILSALLGKPTVLELHSMPTLKGLKKNFFLKFLKKKL